MSFQYVKFWILRMETKANKYNIIYIVRTRHIVQKISAAHGTGNKVRSGH